MPDSKDKKIGQEFGEVRQEVDLEALNAYLKGKRLQQLAFIDHSRKLTNHYSHLNHSLGPSDQDSSHSQAILLWSIQSNLYPHRRLTIESSLRLTKEATWRPLESDSSRRRTRISDLGLCQ